MEIEIGRGKKARRAYGFDDIAIVPSRRTRDPDDVDISWKVGDYRFDLPLLASAMDLMQRGMVPSVSEVAEAAGVSRATAYRYFPTQASTASAVSFFAMRRMPSSAWCGTAWRRRKESHPSR